MRLGPLRKPEEAPLGRCREQHERCAALPSCEAGVGADEDLGLTRGPSSLHLPALTPRLLVMPPSPAAFASSQSRGGGSEAGVAGFALGDAVHGMTDIGSEAPSGPSRGP